MLRRDVDNARNSKLQGKAFRILRSIVTRKTDPLIGLRQLYSLQRAHPGMLRELKPFFALPNLDPDSPEGQAGLKRSIVALAKKIVHPPEK